MEEFSERLNEALRKRGVRASELAKKLEIDEGTISSYRSGAYIPKQQRSEKIAAILRVPIGWLMGSEPSANDIVPLEMNKMHNIPIYESVSAGFGVTAMDSIIDYTPLYIQCDEEASQTLCIRVQGDSMFPKIENGDLVQVVKQDSVDNGQIGVVLLDEDQGFVKKIEFGDDYIKLISFNPIYQDMLFSGKEVQRIKIVGAVRKIIKDATV